mmetsp:Transcript_33177/g.58115  ORF Transcript_33177/g.58115 Transcript_33177/m.58115 type:complete len:128 (-) Transcript_33177:113-496(-)
MRFGDDKRTTLMIRNIPNKCTLSSLMSTFSEVFKGERGLFDFFYLPMDVKSKCNVGYAFINIREQSKVRVSQDFHLFLSSPTTSDQLACTRRCRFSITSFKGKCGIGSTLTSVARSLMGASRGLTPY